LFSSLQIRNRDSLSAAGTSASGGNLFQSAQNAKNRSKDFARSGEPDPEAAAREKKKRGPSRGLAAKGFTTHRERKLKAKQGGDKNQPRGLRDF
jgi:hypothetical protein